MEFGIFEVFKLVGALGFFIYGMKVMSEAIQKVAGDKLRSVMKLITSNRLSAVFTGFLTTSIIQSSSATTVMVVSFVNAGLLKLKEAVSVIMGANIGTTITAVLILVFGFSKFSISAYTLPIIAFGLPMLFSKRSSIKYWGEFMIGFALLFMGLNELKASVPDLKNNPEVLAWIADLNDMGYLAIIISVLVGTLLTVIVQSSSAAMAVTLIMCDNGWIPYEMAAAIVLGENIGTTITANLAALVGNIHAKRAALAHLFFNVFGVIWMLVVFYLFIGAIDTIMVLFDAGSPLHETDAIKWGLTYFHISFNIINTGIMIWFVPQIVNIVTRTIRSKSEDDEEFHLEYIGSETMRTAELSLLEVKKEMSKFAELVVSMNKKVRNLVLETDAKKKQKLYERIQNLENTADNFELEINKYLVKVSEGRLTKESSNELACMLGVTKDLERIADIHERLSSALKRKFEDSFDFADKQKENINTMFGVIVESLKVM
ncbi:MAG: Na/Pi cotransporter family protein, partial [Pseudomonadota bacterium]